MNYMSLFSLVAYAATETHEATEAGGLAALGLDIRALAFQVFNFAILLFLLRLFAYRPILKILTDRRQRIEESLRSAEAIETAKADLTKQTQTIVAQARHDANAILSTSKQEALRLIQAAEARAKVKAAQALKAGQAQLDQDITETKARLKHETAALVALATEAIIDVKLDAANDTELIKKAVAAAKAQLP